MELKRKFIGDRAFYKMVLAIALPIMVQQGITSFVNLLDNVMVGRVGTVQMSGVAIVNQLMFVFNLAVFGGLSGAGIFTAQFCGSGDVEGMRNTLRFKLYIVLGLVLSALFVFLCFGDQLIALFLKGEGSAADIEATAYYSRRYMNIMLITLAPFALSQVFVGTLRETGQTLLPMKSSIVSFMTNLILNYVLIFGKFGAPRLGVEGAAIATAIARFAELGVLAFAVYRGGDKYPMFQKVFSTFRVPASLVKKMVIKGAPLLANELLFSVAVTSLTQSYTLRGLSVVAAVNITSTVTNFFTIAFMALGNSISIIVGQRLGAGQPEIARDTDNKLIAFSLMLSVVMGAVMSLLSPYIPYMYNTEAQVRKMAADFLLCAAVCMPIRAFVNACYFTLRSGGKTVITFLFDCVYMWVVNIPLAYGLVYLTDLNIVAIYFIIQFSEILKCFIGFALVKSGIWIHNLVRS